MAHLIGQDYTPPDLRAKVTGRAKYAEDIRADGMLFCRLLTSPMPHARVRNMDASAALAMEGVVAILTADELPEVTAPGNTILTNEPLYVGAPILAVAAVDETTAQNAIAAIELDLEPLPFCVDPLESLRPDGPNARTDGNTPRGRETEAEQNTSEGVGEIKWTAQDFAAAGEGQMPTGEPEREWSYGDVEAGFANAALVLDESFVTAGHSHHSMEPRSAMAYWQNGKCYVYGSSQSQSFVVPGLAALLQIEPEDLVYFAEFCGGGFGSKGSAYPVMAIPAYMSKKTGRPVLMRISRAEENFIGVCRPAFQGRLKIGFQSDGHITAVDLYIVQDNGPNSGGGGLDGGRERNVTRLHAARHALPRASGPDQHAAQGPDEGAGAEPARHGCRTDSRQGSPPTGSRLCSHPTDQRARQQCGVRCQSGSGHERVSTRGARHRGRAVRLGS